MESNLKMDLFDVLQSRLERVYEYQNITTLLKGEKVVTGDLKKISTIFDIIKDDMGNLHEQLNLVKNKNEEMKEKMVQLEILNKKVIHMTNNIPPYVEQYVSMANDENGLEVEPVNTKEASDHRNALVQGSIANKQEKILLLTPEEFKKIPHYMINRNTIDSLNNLIQTFNEIIEEKYNLIALGKITAKKKGELVRFSEYQKHQTIVNRKQGRSVRFFTDADYNRYMKKNMDKMTLNLCTALRHCKKIEYIRIGKDVYYGICN